MKNDSREKKQSTVVRVTFHEPINNETDFYFGSLKAIYKKFTAEQVGCKLTALYSAGIGEGNLKATDKCVIRKYPVERMAQSSEK